MIFDKEARSIKRNNKLLRSIILPNTGKVLDLSCGDGKLLESIRKSKPSLELFGTDISNQLLNSSINFQVSRADNIPYSAETFNIVICSMSLHHYENILSVLTEIERVLKTNGKLFIMDIIPKNSVSQKIYNLIGCHEPYHFEKFFTKQELSNLMTKFKLKIVSNTPIKIIPKLELIEMTKR